MIRLWICAGAANGFIAVAIGAFSAHLLQDRLSAEALGWVETGMHYELAHALALLAVAWFLRRPLMEQLGYAAVLVGLLMFLVSLVWTLIGIVLMASAREQDRRLNRLAAIRAFPKPFQSQYSKHAAVRTSPGCSPA